MFYTNSSRVKAHRMAVKRSATNILADQTTHEQIRNRRERLSSILERFKELQHQPQHIRSAEMNELESEINDVIFEQTVQYTSRNSRLNPRPKPRKPVRTVVPLLPVPAYREQHEAEFKRSLEYVQVQVTILKALEEHDTVLDPQTAYTWTLNIAPAGQMPEPLQALRLCYYMRSHGYDTYASIKRSDNPEYYECTLRLLLVDPKSDQRGVGYDHLYWMQDCETGEIIFDPHKVLRSEPTATTSERDPNLIITADNNESFMAPRSPTLRFHGCVVVRLRNTTVTPSELERLARHEQRNRGLSCRTSGKSLKPSKPGYLKSPGIHS